ncbi:MAG: hypothetical protein AB1489_03010 [Acidobacteriota bacterium]
MLLRPVLALFLLVLASLLFSACQSSSTASGVGSSAAQQRPDNKPIVPKQNQTQQQPLAMRDGKDRPLLDYYVYLTEKEKLNFNPPREMAANFFRANDMIQFTMTEPKVAIVVAQYNDDDGLTKGKGAFSHFEKAGRKVITVEKYILAVQGGDEKLHEKLKEALSKFNKKG